MKKITTLLVLLYSITAYSQQSNISQQTTNFEISGPKSAFELANEAAKDQGMFTVGNGQVKIVKVGGTGFVSLSTLKKRVEEQMKNYAHSNNLTYKILNTEEQKTSIGVFPKVSVTYQLFDSTGNPYLSKEDKDKGRDAIIKELKQLKELLDLGIITKDEFDIKSSSLKRKLLQN